MTSKADLHEPSEREAAIIDGTLEIIERAKAILQGFGYVVTMKVDPPSEVTE